MTHLTGLPVHLHDAAGRLVIRAGNIIAGSERTWKVIDRPGTDASGGATDIVVPIVLNPEGPADARRAIGSLSMTVPADHGGPGAPTRQTLERTLKLLAGTVGELCQNERELQSRLRELGALYRLSSLVVRMDDADAILNIALELALDVLQMDAGSIMMLAEDSDGVTGTTEDDLLLKSSRHLSQDWLECPSPLSKDRVFDRLALRGEVVASADLLTDDRVLIPERAAAEGLRSALHAGLVVHERPLGVIRLYSRVIREYSESERRLLRSIAQQAALAVEQARLRKIQQADERLQRQLQLAADVQRRMLPRTVPNSARLDLAARYVPSFELGGDFYDFIELSGHMGVAIGDVVGKGIAAALLMSAVRASLRAFAQDVYDLDEVLARVNVAMCRDTLDNEFATIWYGVVDPATLRLTYCSAGHEPTIVVRVPPHRSPSSADIDELATGGMAVGIDRSQRYQRATYDLKPGDVIVAYTDGVPDTINFETKKFTKARLRRAVLNILTQEPAAGANRIADHILWELRQFAGLASRIDDQTLVVMRVRG